MRVALEPLLLANRVNAVFVGHVRVAWHVRSAAQPCDSPQPQQQGRDGYTVDPARPPPPLPHTHARPRPRPRRRPHPAQVHAYQRTHLVDNNSVVDPGTGAAGMYHFMVGTSGKELYQTWSTTEFPWVAARNATFWGPAFLYVPNATHARFRIHCAAGDTYACDPTVPADEFWFENHAL